MNDIKFRAWDNGGFKIRKVLGMSFEHGAISVELNNEKYLQDDASRFELMQYTGLKDKNGKEIYEGDILEWDGDREGISKLPSDYIIEVLKSNHLYIELKEHTNTYMFHYDTSGYNFPHFLEEAGIVGNIYEHPELLGDNQ